MGKGYNMEGISLIQWMFSTHMQSFVLSLSSFSRSSLFFYSFSSSLKSEWVFLFILLLLDQYFSASRLFHSLELKHWNQTFLQGFCSRIAFNRCKWRCFNPVDVVIRTGLMRSLSPSWGKRKQQKEARKQTVRMAKVTNREREYIVLIMKTFFKLEIFIGV